MGDHRISRMRTIAAKARGFFGGCERDSAFDDEVQVHLDLLAERFVAQGMSQADALAAARRQFGNTTLLREDRRELRTLVSLEDLGRDLRYAVRTLWKSRGFAAVAIVTLGLGIGASTAIFSVIDNVLLSPFPYKDAVRMVFLQVRDTQSGSDGGRQGYTPTEYLELAEQNHVFDGTTAASDDLLLYKKGDGAEQLYGAHVTPGTFEFFGMPALLGRVLQPADYEPGAPPVFVMRFKTWVTQFNGDPNILNKVLILNDTPRTLVGIMPPRFGWYEADVLIPEKLTRDTKPTFAGFSASWFFLGRLKPGVTTQQAEADMTVLFSGLAKIRPQDYPTHFLVMAKKLGDTVVGRFEATLYTVLAAVGLLLLIGCGNVANLMLARATAREKEFALRAVLGAGRARLVRLLLVESLLLALGGAALGVLIAWGGLKSLVAAMPQNTIPAESVIELNAPVLAFTLAVAALTALIFGLVPALQATRRDLNDPLRDSGKGVSGGFRIGRLRDAVVVMEVAMSLVLLIGAGLLMRSFVALREVRLGLHADHVLQAQLPLPGKRYETALQVRGFFEPLIARLKALPGVEEASESSSIPPYGGVDSKMEIAGRTHSEDWHTLWQHASEGYFRVLRIEFKNGRGFTETEVNDARKVAVVNETFVRKYFSRGENPLGQRVRVAQLETLGDPVREPFFEIVGVVGDVTNLGLQAPTEPEVWIPYTVTGSGAQVLMVRTARDPALMMNAMRQAVWATDSDVALAFPSTLEDRINERVYAGPRFGFLLMTIFGGIGLVLVTVGVYSVLAYATARKTHEIGIRMALGAERRDVLGLVIHTGLRLVLGGIGLGLAVSLILGRMITTQLNGVPTYDPATLAGTTILLVATGAMACWIPARRAARLDPTAALRYE
jgi:putative ABC transport system permease protein